jgi:radical SAM superfamily enzyme YgiQ (UPF0313 family)
MAQIDLINPRHNCAPKFDGKEYTGQIYMPTALLTVAAKLIDASVDVNIYDENIRPAKIGSDIVGIGLTGAPYIPVARNIIERINRTNPETKYLIGGTVVDGLTSEQFSRLFGKKAYAGSDKNVREIVSIEETLTADRQISLIPAYEKLTDTVMKEYLSREFSLYVSQGCRFNCTFCAAAKNKPEQYRDLDIITKDLGYLTKKAARYGLKELNMYMSNLDVFQTPDVLKEFAKKVIEVKKENPKIDIKLRGLSTVEMYLKARKDRELIGLLKKAGFHTVGFGVDGATAEVHKKTRKPIGNEQDCIDAIILAHSDGFTPEALMVFGHENVDNEDSLRAAYDFAKEMQDKYGAIPRPHVSKAFVPGNEGWKKGYEPQIESIMTNPELFQCLDFTALPTELTHPDRIQRQLATKYYLKMCQLEKNTTQPLLPIKLGMTRTQIEKVNKSNEGKFDR